MPEYSYIGDVPWRDGAVVENYRRYVCCGDLNVIYLKITNALNDYPRAYGITLIIRYNHSWRTGTNLLHTYMGVESYHHYDRTYHSIYSNSCHYRMPNQ